MKIKFNPTGTHIRKGKLLIRLDLYPDSKYKTYAIQFIDIFARALTKAESERVDEVLTEKAKNLQKLVPTKKQLNPFLCHFIAIDPNMTKIELKKYIKETFDVETLTKLDNILSVNNRNNELNSALRGKYGKQEEFFGTVNTREINNKFVNFEVNI